MLAAIGLAIGAGGIIPANPGWQEPEEGVRLFIRTNGVHTWIMVPKVTAEMDWRPWAPGEHIRDPRYAAGDYVAIGYGNRQFYLEVPTWADLDARTALLAAFGQGRSLIQMEHVWRPEADEWQRPLVVTREEYRRLVRFLAASFERDARGRTVPLIGRGYGPADVFYEARGDYTAARSCNEWTGEALRAAGVRTGVWTPLSWSILRRLD
jgi:uncharacterized protein (TIGR02117 family)